MATEAHADPPYLFGTLIPVGWLAVEGAQQQVFCVRGSLEIQVVRI